MTTDLSRSITKLHVPPQVHRWWSQLVLKEQDTFLRAVYFFISEITGTRAPPVYLL